MSLRTLFHPELSHHKLPRRPFFEGWYCKMVAADGSMLAIIPGYFKGKNPTDDHAFIQIYDTNRSKSAFIRYPAETYHAAPDALEIEIAGSRFTPRGITLNIDALDDAGTPWQLAGTVTFSELLPWPRHFLSPNAMGWYSFVPFMECNHAVLSFDHTLRGTISDSIAGIVHDFNGGRGYIEKDWGSSFPSEYLWLQGNQFASHPGASIFLSIATIPWLGSSFPGHIGGLWLGDQHQEFHLFAKYNGSSVLALQADERDVLALLQRSNLILRIRAHRDRAVPLSAPYHGSMQTKILESAGTNVNVELFLLRPDSIRPHSRELAASLSDIDLAAPSEYLAHIRGTELLFDDTTTAACLETVGDLSKLAAQPRQAARTL
ncbi:MAG: tocopherol cyclase family protein [Rectinemataceae bacterium]